MPTTNKELDLEIQLLEGILRKVRQKGLMEGIAKEEYRIEFIMGLQIAIQHCIECSSYIQEIKNANTTTKR